jgi:hypothetical protein
MAFKSTSAASTAVDTAKSLYELTGVDMFFHLAFFTIDDAATGTVAVGGIDVKIATKKGTPLQPGQTHQWPGTTAPGPYHTKQTYLAFEVNAATEAVWINLLPT